MIQGLSGVINKGSKTIIVTTARNPLWMIRKFPPSGYWVPISVWSSSILYNKFNQSKERAHDRMMMFRICGLGLRVWSYSAAGCFCFGWFTAGTCRTMILVDMFRRVFSATPLWSYSKWVHLLFIQSILTKFVGCLSALFDLTYHVGFPQNRRKSSEILLHKSQSESLAWYSTIIHFV